VKINAIRSLVEVCRSLEEKAWNINIEAKLLSNSAQPNYKAGDL